MILTNKLRPHFTVSEIMPLAIGYDKRMKKHLAKVREEKRIREELAEKKREQEAEVARLTKLQETNPQRFFYEMELMRHKSQLANRGIYY